MMHFGGSVGVPVILPGSYTVDTLPDPASNVGKYARVTDLFGSKTDLVLAAVDQTGNYWQPVRPDYKGVMTVSSDTVLIPLKTPSILSINGTVPLGTTRTLSLGNTNLFPGAKFTIRTKLASLLGSLQILDTVKTALSGLLINQSYTYIYDPVNGWEQI